MTTGTTHVRIEEIVSTKEFAAFVVEFRDRELMLDVLGKYSKLLKFSHSSFEIRLNNSPNGFLMEVRQEGWDEFTMWGNVKRIRERLINSAILNRQGLRVVVADEAIDD